MSKSSAPLRERKRLKRTLRSTRTTKRASSITSDALEIIDRMIGDDPAMKSLVADAGIKARLARLIYDARTDARLTQTQLAKRSGTTQSVIARLEDADYEGHSLSMLNRVARALNRRLEVHLLPAVPGKTPAA